MATALASGAAALPSVAVIDGRGTRKAIEERRLEQKTAELGLRPEDLLGKVVASVAVVAAEGLGEGIHLGATRPT